MLDSTDRLRVCVAKEELDQLLRHEELTARPVPVLFFANKMDVPSAMAPDECCEGLELDLIRGRPWHILPSNAVTGDGIDDGVEWLCDQLARSNNKK